MNFIIMNFKIFIVIATPLCDNLIFSSHCHTLVRELISDPSCLYVGSSFYFYMFGLITLTCRSKISVQLIDLFVSATFFSAFSQWQLEAQIVREQAHAEVHAEVQAEVRTDQLRRCRTPGHRAIEEWDSWEVFPWAAALAKQVATSSGVTQVATLRWADQA